MPRMNRTIFLILLLSTFSFACGSERWQVKTLQDTGIGRINVTPQEMTVRHMAEFTAPDSRPPDVRGDGPEVQLYTMHVLVHGYKQESDQDFHVVISDPSDVVIDRHGTCIDHTSGLRVQCTMVAEIPHPDCGIKEFSERWDNMRALMQTMGHASVGRMVWFAKPIPVELWGIGFFDFLHGQTGMAKNGLEIHPVLYLKREDQ